MKRLGLYVHIPFCIRKCFYCDFCSFPGSDSTRMRVYTEELCRRLAAEGLLAPSNTVGGVTLTASDPRSLPLFTSLYYQ
jgi:oxygen-independent coproporphyrinogen-3 oxidase